MIFLVHICTHFYFTVNFWEENNLENLVGNIIYRRFLELGKNGLVKERKAQKGALSVITLIS